LRTKMYKRILIATDGTELANKAGKVVKADCR